MKKYYKLSGGLAVVLLFSNPSDATAISPSQALGIAGSIYHWLDGTTTVTPQTALNYWRQIEEVDYHGTTTRTYRRVTRDHLTGTFLYDYELKVDGVVTEQNTNPFLLGSAARQSYYCDANGDGTVVYEKLKHFTVAASASSVVKTGGFPPGEPYPGVAKSYGSDIQSDCSSVGGGRDFREGFNVYDSGTTVFQFDTVNVDYAWPVLAWVGGFYEY